MRYAAVYEETEKYLAKHAKEDVVMLGGRIGVQLVLGRPRSTDTYMFNYELYTENAFKHANDLTNIVSVRISPHGSWEDKKGEFIIWLKTYGSGKYGIYVDNRQIVTIIGVPHGTVNIVKPELVKSFDRNKEFAVIPAEIQLLDIYRTLYTPGETGLWEEYLSDENQLFHHLRKREKAIRGAASEDDGVSHSDRVRITNTIMQKFIVNNPDVILLGEHALFVISEDPIKTHILQVCTTMDAGEVLAKLKMLGGMPQLTIKKKQLNIMKDFMLHRAVIKVGDKELMYIYNSASYELLPFNTVHANGKSFLRLANPFVILRFLLVEIWMVRWVQAKGKIDETYAKRRIDAMLSRILRLRKQMSEGSQSDRAITTISDSYFGSTSEEKGMKIFQIESDDYIGTFISEIILQKEAVKEQKKYRDYMPQRYYAETGGYRKL
jgi:hypothetical protein